MLEDSSVLGVFADESVAVSFPHAANPVTDNEAISPIDNNFFMFGAPHKFLDCLH